ncbi:PaaI family thioesterase [Acinetobacter faecalis]|uniref:PaaI family thioesterase n=1 Tax=Acinetobacter faecalis TaxID=2665161 RepID=UPI002A90E265|nr:PaaI family thioesterase [Acinetobacter faecalis]MDY6449654.1 PaaI family thioesterase [Acinetobacter faecalis]MDY6456988.1 PaaI family thioesterase [Acinetobacter faecalis]MDY6462526.1 PaaI family thioesterase [Acinetobacter faecalis]MDY6467528.1 PaaI family thioesterase [Acinetobacter faecalis]MDY6482061.1 PaaI family thioesterase [Acinetobacter faecalis]
MKSNKAEIIEFLKHDFPQSLVNCEIEDVFSKGSRLIYKIDQEQLRPGGTVSGPTMMTLADLALYVAILGEIGIIALAVTTNLNINFLRKPVGNQNLKGECRLIKVGCSLIVGEVWIYSAGMDDPVAHVTATYVIP